MDNNVQIIRIQIIAVVGSCLLIGHVFNLIRKGKLRENYGLLWFEASVCVLLLSIFRGALDSIAHFIGVAYAPAALFLAALVFGLLILLYFSVTLSDNSEKIKKLTQEISLMKEEYETGSKKNIKKKKR